MKSCIFFGDSHSELSVYLDGVNKIGINGLPINDHSLKRLFRIYSSPDVIFFSCGFPLMGCTEIKHIETLQSKPPEYRLIPFDSKPQSRGFYNSTFWQKLSQTQIDLLFVNWKQMVEYYYNQQSKVVLLPLAAHFYDQELGLSLSAMQQINQLERVVDLSPLNNIDNREEIYTDKYGHLSRLGWDRIEANVLEWMQ